MQISIPLTNYKGEDEDFRITFNPALNTVEDIAFALCNQQKVWFGLSTTEDIDTICVGPVSKLISSYFAENQSQNLLNSSGDSLTSAPLEEGMIEVNMIFIFL